VGIISSKNARFEFKGIDLVCVIYLKYLEII
jgi:hypothetical protein